MGFGSFEVVVNGYLTSVKKGHIFIKHVFSPQNFFRITVVRSVFILWELVILFIASKQMQ